MGLLSKYRSHPRPTVEGWRVAQHSGKDVPHEIVWPEDVCHRCKVQGQMYFGSGKPQCGDCEERTVVQIAPSVGLHERRRILELEG
jgi:hypothetical protein